MARLISFDFETYSDVDLKKRGTPIYARDPSTQVDLIAFTFDENIGAIRQWDRYSGEPMPNEFLDALEDERVVKQAFNAAFEQQITRYVLGIDIDFDEWEDPQVHARLLSFPGALKEVAPALRLPEEYWKLEGGDALVRFFSQPRKPTKTNPATRNIPGPQAKDAVNEKWDRYKRYNRQDVVAQIKIAQRLRLYPVMKREWSAWRRDRLVNESGVPVDLDAVENAAHLVRWFTKRAMDEMADITGLDNPNSGQQLLPWLQDRGYRFTDLKAGHVRRALEDIGEPTNKTSLRDVLQRRVSTSKAAFKKYDAYMNATCEDGLLRNQFVFAGAGRTARWAGTQVQLQNLYRPNARWESREMQEELAYTIKHMHPRAFELWWGNWTEALASGVRGVISAPEGMVFCDADLNAIENRVVGYEADEDKILNVFAQNRCPYVDFATYMFHEDYDTLWKEYKGGNKKKRTTAKPAVLGAGYGLSAGQEFENEQTGEIEATGLLGYAWNMGVKMTPAEAKMSIDVWRGTFTKVVDLWADLDTAFRRVISSGRRQDVGPFEFRLEDDFATIRLPSGRKLFYFRPRIQFDQRKIAEERRLAREENRPPRQPRKEIFYEGVDNKAKKKTWGPTKTYGGKILENTTQAIARDIIDECMARAERRGLDVRLHVHDQIVTLSREDRAEHDAKVLAECMNEPMPWAPKLPLKAEAEIAKIWVKT